MSWQVEPCGETRSATNGARWLMERVGFVVIGTALQQAWTPEMGVTILVNFAGHPLEDGLVLRVIGLASRRAWDRQVEMLGMKDPNVHALGERFYRCVLEAGPTDVILAETNHEQI